MRMLTIEMLLLVGLSLPWRAAAGAGDPPPKPKVPPTHLHDDPLPEGAVARFGSIRFRHAGLSDYLLLSPNCPAACPTLPQPARPLPRWTAWPASPPPHERALAARAGGGLVRRVAGLISYWLGTSQLFQRRCRLATSGGEQGEYPPQSSPFAALPSYGSYLAPDGGSAEVVHLFECGECKVPSRYARGYSLLTIIFVFVFAVWRVDEMMKCPRCMRRHIIVRFPLAILLSNLVSPVIVVWWLVVFVRTFIRPF